VPAIPARERRHSVRDDFALVDLQGRTPEKRNRPGVGLGAERREIRQSSSTRPETIPARRAALTWASVPEWIHFHVTGTGVVWFLLAGSLFTVAMYGAAETLAARVPRTEEYIGRVPAIAIVPWFLAGSLFPISALPAFLTWFARFLPLTHALALVRYGLPE
jgi:hypothetical protein